MSADRPAPRVNAWLTTAVRVAFFALWIAAVGLWAFRDVSFVGLILLGLLIGGAEALFVRWNEGVWRLPSLWRTQGE